MAIKEETFREHLGQVSSEEFGAFVADLWTARGWETNRVHDNVVLFDSKGCQAGTVSPMVDTGEDNPTDDVDVVVMAQDPSEAKIPDGVEIVGPTELHQIVNYAIERDVRDQLLKAHLDYDPSAIREEGVEEPSWAESRPSAVSANRPNDTAWPTGDTSTTTDESPHLENQQLASANEESPEQASEDVVQPAEKPEATEEGQTDSVTEKKAGGNDESSVYPTRRTVLITGASILAGAGALAATHLTQEGEASMKVPGLTSDGVDNPGALAGIHVNSLSDTSFTLEASLTIRNADRSLRILQSLRVAISENRAYLAHVSTHGPGAPNTFGDPPADAVYWSDGEVFLKQSEAGNERYSRFRGPTGFVGTWSYWANTVPFIRVAQTGAQYYRTIFESIPTRLAEERLRNEETIYWVVDERGRPNSNSRLERSSPMKEIRDVHLDAGIHERGTIQSFTVQYTGDIDSDTAEIRRVINYAEVGETTVERPSWYDETGAQ